MGSVEGTDDDREFDVDETIFVAVGKRVEKSKTTLFWAAQSFAGKKICLLHVHQPPLGAALTNRKLAGSRFKHHAVEALQELETQKLQGILNENLLVLIEAGVQADKVWIEREDVGKGIIELIARYKIRWLVMGAASDKYYSSNLTELKSKKAIFVCEEAPMSCHIWFSCKGCLIYTRVGKEEKSDSEVASSLQLLDSNTETERSIRSVRSLGARIDIGQSEEKSEWFDFQSSLNLSLSTSRDIGTSESTPFLTNEGGKFQGQTAGINIHRLEKAIFDLKVKVTDEAVKRWKVEDSAMEANCKAKALESLCIKEITRRKEIEELLSKEKQEVERMKNQHGEHMKKLEMVKNQKMPLEAQITEVECSVKELEDKIISAVELLISFKKKRDELRKECKKIVREIRALRTWNTGEGASFPGTRFLECSFLEINEGTHDFDQSWKIGEGKYGSIYKGIIRHAHVAIKMLPTYGSQSLSEFQYQVEVLSRVRHPNLVTLIGTCPESRSLIYEYLTNGSLEDRLSCKDNTLPLSWESRTQIASEICSALIFLHSNTPCIPHGSLRPSKVLLDSNFASKLIDFGIYRLIAQGENTAQYKSANLNVMDSDDLDMGKFTEESDIHSFGIILLRLLTGRPVLRIVRDVKGALKNENWTVLDGLAGDWPRAQARQLAQLALMCCDENHINQPDLSEISSLLEQLKASSTTSTSFLGSEERPRVPSQFVCPILQEVMKDPQIAADGFTYEGEAIQGWLKSGHNTSPMTNLKLENTKLLPNYALHQAIQEWQR